MLFTNPVRASHIIKQTKTQIYIAPHPLLSSYIAHYTMSFPVPYIKNPHKREPKNITLIPDASGCMIFTYEKGRLSQHLWGPTTKVVQVQDEPSHPIYRLFIEFLPGGLYALTKINQCELSDRQYTLSEVDRSFSLTLTDIIESSTDLNVAIEQINTFFLKIIDSCNKAPTPLLPILNTINAHSGQVQIKDLATASYISQRHLNRLFEKHIGMNAKQFARLVRINKTVSVYKAGSYATSSEVAQALGFFDESHLIKDFKELCDATPTAFLKNMSNFYNEPFKY